MSRIAKAALLTAAAGAALAGTAGIANADAGAAGGAAHSPGVLSGNNVQVPIHIPINICGNTVNVIGALNPTFGNECENNSTTIKVSDQKKAKQKKSSNNRQQNSTTSRR
jgi:ChpA-C